MGASIGAGKYGYKTPNRNDIQNINNQLNKKTEQAGVLAASSLSLPLMIELFPGQAIRVGVLKASDDFIGDCKSPEAREWAFRACVAIELCTTLPKGKEPENFWIKNREIPLRVREEALKQAATRSKEMTR